MADENRGYPKGVSGQPAALEVLGENIGRKMSPSIGRNREVVREALLDNIDHNGALLEIGSGTGEHGVFVTELAPKLDWTFTDYNEDAFTSISAWIEHTGRSRLHGPYKLDASAPLWGEPVEGQRFDALFSANVIHISPFTVTEGLFAGAGRLLKPDGRLALYGPFAEDGDIAESNARFDADLKRRDPSWGVHDIKRELLPLAEKNKLKLALQAGMPANNMTLVFERA